jgi:predicted nucleic acid-binding protein
VAHVALDAGVIIASLDAAYDQHERAVDALRARLAAGDRVLVCTSVYAEVMMRPAQRGTAATVDEFFDAIGAAVVAVDRGAARHAAQLRARHSSLRLPDALTLATAMGSGADLLTFDDALRRIDDGERAEGTGDTVIDDDVLFGLMDGGRR